MAAVGGILKTVTIDGRHFAGLAAITIFTGGLTKTLTATGANSVVMDAKPELWEIKSIKVRIDPDADDLEYLRDVQSSLKEVPCSCELLSGIAYAGIGTIVERVEFNTEGTAAEFTLQGSETLEQL